MNFSRTIFSSFSYELKRRDDENDSVDVTNYHLTHDPIDRNLMNEFDCAFREKCWQAIRYRFYIFQRPTIKDLFLTLNTLKWKLLSCYKLVVGSWICDTSV